MTLIEVRNCGRCHTCGRVLRQFHDGEWCDQCEVFRRYTSHGWGGLGAYVCQSDWLSSEELSAPVANSAAAWDGN